MYAQLLWRLDKASGRRLECPTIQLLYPNIHEEKILDTEVNGKGTLNMLTKRSEHLCRLRIKDADTTLLTIMS
jgi:hypothetical protein